MEDRLDSENWKKSCAKAKLAMELEAVRADPSWRYGDIAAPVLLA